MFYFKWLFIVMVIGLGFFGWLGYVIEGDMWGIMFFFFVGVVLVVLEIVLFFDNVIVNVNKFEEMMLVW